MPKPQHVDAKLYDIIMLLFPDGFYRHWYLCRFLFELHVRLQIKPSSLVEPAQRREMKEVYHHMFISVV